MDADTQATSKRPAFSKEVGLRFKAAIDLFETKKEAANTLGISVDQLARYIKAEASPSLAILSALTEAKKVRIDWLATGEGEMFGDTKPAAITTQLSVEGDAGDDYVLIPQLDVEASAGPGTLIDRENVLGFLAFREDWVRRTLHCSPEKLAVITARGDSMEPTIKAGDALLVETGVPDFLDGAIYVLAAGSSTLVKRIKLSINGSVSIMSDNPRYPEERLTPEEAEAVQIAGMVRWIGRLC